MSDPQNPANPEDIDVAALLGQLAQSSVAFGTANPANERLGADLQGALHKEGADVLGDAGIVVLEQTPAHIPDLRDLAQDIAIGSDLDTVIVRTPHVAIGVSDTLTRAQIERGQRAMVAQPDYAVGLDAFVAEASEFGIAWGGVMGAFLAGVVAVVGASAAASRR